MSSMWKRIFKKTFTGLPEWFGKPGRVEGVRFCSHPCYSEWKKTQNPWNKGKKGVQKCSEEKKIKLSEKWRMHREQLGATQFSGSRWAHTRRDVLKRDNYTCKKCGHTEVEIMCVDHIIPKKLEPSLYYKMDNCMTLCPNCHARKTIEDKKMILQKLRDI